MIRDFTRSGFNFSYQEVEIGARVFDEGFAWETIRRARIVSLRNNLYDIEIGVQLENTGTGATSRVEPNDFDLVTPDPRKPTRLSTKATKYIVRSNTPINKYKSKEFIFHYSFRKIQSRNTEQLFWASSTRPVEKLTLRLVLNDSLGYKVYQQVLDTLGTSELSSAEVLPDTFNNEYSWTIIRPRKDRLYNLYLGKGE